MTLTPSSSSPLDPDTMAHAGLVLSLAEKMVLWDSITKYLGACGVTKVPAWDPARDASAAEVEKTIKSILLKREVIIESRFAAPQGADPGQPAAGLESAMELVGEYDAASMNHVVRGSATAFAEFKAVREKMIRALSAPSQGPAAWLDAGSSPLARGTAASGPRREALALAITDYSTGAESISYTVDRVLALLGEAPPKASEAEHPSPNSPPGATVQPQARPMKLRAEVWAKDIKVIQEDEIGDFLVFRWDIVGSDARKAAEEIAYRINSFEPQAEGGAE